MHGREGISERAVRGAVCALGRGDSEPAGTENAGEERQVKVETSAGRSARGGAVRSFSA